MKLLLATFNAKYVHSSLALYSLRANMPEGTDADILEMTINMPFMSCLSEVAEKKPDLLLLSTYIWNLERTLKLVGEIKKILPSVRIFLGGPEPTGQGSALLDEQPDIEGIFMGESEGTFREFVSRVMRGDVIQGIDGLLLRSQPYHPRDYLAMDSLRFPYRDEDLAANRDKLIYYESSRGCPFSCSYCLSSLEKRTRYKPLETVFSELKKILAYRPQTIKFVDRTFNLDMDRTKTLLRFIRDLGPQGTCFHFEVSADLFDEETLAILEEMPDNLVQLEVGLQSTNPDTLSLCQRKTDVDAIRSNLLRLVKKENIHIHLDLIAGLPGEDYGSFARSLSEALAMRPHMLQLGFLKLLPGSSLSEDRTQFGMVALEDPPYEVLETEALGFEELSRLKKAESVLDGFYNSNIMRNLMSVMPSTYPGGPLAFFLDLEERYRKETDGPYKGIVRRFHAVWTMIADVGACGDKELLSDLLLLDYCLLDRRKFMPDFFQEGQDVQTAAAETLAGSLDLQRMILEVTGTRTLKEVHKLTRLISVSPHCYRWMQALPLLLDDDQPVAPEIQEGLRAALQPLMEEDPARRMLLLDYSVSRGIFSLPHIRTIC